MEEQNLESIDRCIRGAFARASGEHTEHDVPLDGHRPRELDGLFLQIGPAPAGPPRRGLGGGHPRERTMTNVRVAIFSPDRLRHAGITAMLENAEGLSIRPFQVNQRHDVIVVVANEITKGRIKPVTLAWHLFDTPSVVIADERIEFDVDAAVEAGVVSAMHLREATTERVLDAIRQAADIGVGSAARPNGLISQVLRIQRYPVDHDAKPDLSQSEIVVLRQFAAGCSTLEVAREMQLSERTVKYVLWRLMQRFELRNRAHAVAFAIRSGVI